MKLEVIGSSPAWPNPGAAHAGLLLSGSGRLLLDCGPGVLARLRDRHEDGWPRVDAIAITHFHLDHWGDLVPWVWGTSFGLGRALPRPELWVQPGGRERLRSFGGDLGRAGMFENAFQVREYEERTPFEAGGFRVTPVRVPHYTLETYAFRVDEDEDACVVCYSGDAAPCDALVDAARDADLFVCEATLERGELDGTPRGHLSADEAIDAFRLARARRLLLTHRPAEFPPPDGVEVAYDGFEVDL